MSVKIFIISVLTLAIHSSKAGNSDPSQAATICAQQNSDGTLISHKDCNKFYKCFQGHPVTIFCPDNLLWNSEREYCDWPQNVNCQRSYENEILNDPSIDEKDYYSITSNEASRICAAIDSEGTHVAHDDCNKFYICSGHIPVLHKCPANLYYNSVKRVCDWQENVTCNK